MTTSEKNNQPDFPRLKQKFSILENNVAACSRFLLMTHPNPDGDAIGSVLAFKKFLQEKGKEVIIYSEDDLANKPSISDQWQPITTELVLENYDCLINLDRGANLNEIPERDRISIINIDHHPDGRSARATINIVDHNMSATSEILYHFFVYTGYKIDNTSAFYILSGIFSDTGGFKHANTNKRVMEIASRLIRPGSILEKLSQLENSSGSLKTLRLWGVALDRAEMKPNQSIVTFITQKDLERCGADEEDIGLISELLNTVPEAKFSLVLSERKDGVVKGSLRSELHKETDVSQIAHQFGGGGHKLAAGFSLPGKLEYLNGNWKVV